jgi:hypothetical protein
MILLNVNYARISFSNMFMDFLKFVTDYSNRARILMRTLYIFYVIPDQIYFSIIFHWEFIFLIREMRR